MTYHEQEPGDRHRRIARAIVGGNPEAERLYGESASYRAWVDTMGHMLPMWAEGAAAHAGRIDEQARLAADGLRAMGDPLTRPVR